LTQVRLYTGVPDVAAPQMALLPDS